MSNNNFLIDAVKCLLDCKGRLKINTREQLTKNDVNVISMYCGRAIKLINEKDTGQDVSLIIANLYNAKVICDTSFNDVKFTVTDSQTKEFIANKLLESLNSLCLVTGKYYTSEHTFTLNNMIFNTYNYIVDRCIDQNYNFGLEGEV